MSLPTPCNLPAWQLVALRCEYASLISATMMLTDAVDKVLKNAKVLQSHDYSQRWRCKVNAGASSSWSTAEQYEGPKSFDERCQTPVLSTVLLGYLYRTHLMILYSIANCLDNYCASCFTPISAVHHEFCNITLPTILAVAVHLNDFFGSSICAKMALDQWQTFLATFPRRHKRTTSSQPHLRSGLGI